MPCSREPTNESHSVPHEEILDMRGRDLCLVTYDEIAKDYNNVGTFAFIDLHQQTPEKWLASNATQRRCAIRGQSRQQRNHIFAIRRTEQTAEKSHLYALWWLSYARHMTRKRQKH